MIEKHTCKNGVRIILENIPNVRSVAIGIWVLIGSRNESEEDRGISHFVEHMMFKGTETRSPQDIAESFDSIGGQVNAFTSKEYTCYYARVVDTHKQYALDILTDMFFNSVFDEEELEREKQVVLEEIKMYEDTPDDHVHDLLSEASFGDHPLGKSIIGTSDHVNSFNREKLIDYVNSTYNPNNIVVSIAGNVDEGFIKEVEAQFELLNREQKTEQLEKPIFLENEIILPKDVEQAHLCLGFNGLAVDDENMSSLLVLNNALGGGMSSRLFQEVREKRGLAYSVYSYHRTYLDSGLLTIYAGTGKERQDELNETIQNIIEDIKNNGLTEKELNNSKEQFKGNNILRLESTNSRMSRNGRNELMLRKHRTLDDIIKEINEVNDDTVRQVIDNVLSENHSMALITPNGHE